MAPLPNFLCTGEGAATNDNPGATASNNPSPAGTPKWSSLLESRYIPAYIRNTSVRAPTPTYFSVSEDPPLTLGVAALSANKIPTGSLCGIGAITANINDLSWCQRCNNTCPSRGLSCGTRHCRGQQYWWCTARCFYEANRGVLSIPWTTATPKVSVTFAIDALYVHRMYRYMTGVAHNLLACRSRS